MGRLGPYDDNEIYCGDSYKLIHDLPSGCVDLIIMDVPYLIEGLHSGQHGIFKGRPDDTRFDIQLLNSSLEVGFDFNSDFLRECVRVMKKINCYIWCNKELIKGFLDFFMSLDVRVNFEILCWYKSNCPPFCGNHYLKDKEYCLYFWEQGASVDIPYERGHTVFLSSVNKEDKKKYGHPTCKPVPILETLITNSSKPGDLVCDFFAGSGSTLEAAKNLGRRYLGFEINEKWYEVAKNRVEYGEDINGCIRLF